jgi:hypothetical protein
VEDLGQAILFPEKVTKLEGFSKVKHSEKRNKRFCFFSGKEETCLMSFFFQFRFAEDLGQLIL